MTLVVGAGWALWALVGFLAGQVWGLPWLRRLFEDRGRHAARATGRHAVSPPVDQGSYAQPELAGWQRVALAGVVSWAEQDPGPAAIANGRELADWIRLDELAPDLAAAGVLLHVVEYSRRVQEHASCLPEDLDPDELAGLVGEAVMGAVFDLTSLHRATA